MRVFISHSSKDKKLAEQLVQLLKNAFILRSDDIRYTSAPGYGLEGGTPILETLRKDVLEADVVIGLLTPQSLDSIYVIFELGARWGAKKPMIPLCAQGVTPNKLSEPLKSLVAFDCSDKVQLQRFLEDVARILALDPEKPSTYAQQIDQLADAASAAANSGNHNEDVQDDGSRRVASHGEIVGASTANLLQLDLEWADLESRRVLPSPHTVSALILDPTLPGDTFEMSAPQVRDPLGNNVPGFSLTRPDPDYSEKLILFAFSNALFKPVSIRLHNSSGVFGKGIGFVGSLMKFEGMFVLEEMPPPPSKTIELFSASVIPLASRHDDEARVVLKEREDRWEIKVEFGDIRPHDNVWMSSPLWFGSMISQTARLDGELRGENIPDPIQVALDIRFETERRPMTEEDVHNQERAYIEALGLDDN